jgi:hypothetical protein
MKPIDRFALVISILAILVSAWIANTVFENIPHIEDEIAYVWQANIIARGDLYLPSPPCPKCFLVPFVIDYNGIRFGKYPPGWPAILGLGVKLGVRDWVNPFFAGFSIWLLYLLIKRISNEKIGLLAIFLTITSPFFLMNAGSLLSHIWSLWLTLVFILSWLDIVNPTEKSRIPTWIPVITGGGSIGLLALTRPLTAAGIAIPFVFHGIYLLIKANRKIRRSALILAVITAGLAALVPLWQAAVTGNFLLNPYQLWWPYDKLGFGPEIGLQPGGFSWLFAKMNTKFSLRIGYSDLFGWFKYSWIFIPFGIFYLRKNWKALLVSATLPFLILAYTLYWIGSWLFGPRYYFEGIIVSVLLSAAGIYWLAGTFNRNQQWFKNLRWFFVVTLVAFLVSANIFLYTPLRLDTMNGLYGARQSQLTPFLSDEAMKLTPALVIVHKQNHWIEYGTLLELSSPYYDSPWLFTYYRGPEFDRQLTEFFNQRKIWHYYPDEPYKLYTAPRESGER